MYHDIGRAMRALLVTQCGLSVEDAIRLTPHGFRHLLVTAGVQLRRQGHVDTCGLGTLGLWNRNSESIEQYDAESGVTQLDTRDNILDASRMT